MRLALEQAERAYQRDEVPVGALIVRNVTVDASTSSQQPQHSFEILAAQHNRVESLCDASAHAELLALRAASRAIRNWRLSAPVRKNNSTTTTTLYATLEPCPVCLASAQAFRVTHLVYGAPDFRLGAVASHLRLLDVAPHPFHNISTVTAGVLQEECGAVLRSFFREQRLRRKQERQQPQANTTTTNASKRSRWWSRLGRKKRRGG